MFSLLAQCLKSIIKFETTCYRFFADIIKSYYHKWVLVGHILI